MNNKSEYKAFGLLTKQEQDELKTAWLLGLQIQSLPQPTYLRPTDDWVSIHNPA